MTHLVSVEIFTLTTVVITCAGEVGTPSVDVCVSSDEGRNWTMTGRRKQITEIL
jgi:hypothetical protein